MRDLVILRNRKGVPGIGRKLSRALELNEVTAGYRPNIRVPDNAIVLNYGVGRRTIWHRPDITYINHPDAVAKSVDKRTCLDVLSGAGVPCLNFTTSQDEAQLAITNGKGVIVRATATGKQGKGVSLVTRGTVPKAPLYTEFYDKTHEFRVHVFDGQVIDIAQKKRLGKKKREERGIEVDDLVRNHKRGWVFAHKDIYDFPELREYAIAACHALGLTYSGIDMLAKINERTGRLIDCVVCESNSAPGMSSPTTFRAYLTAIQAFQRDTT